MTIILKKNRKHTLVFIILAFYLMFAPPIFGIHSLYFVAAFSWVYILVNNGVFFRIIDRYNLGKIYVGLLLMFVWASLVVFLNDGTRSVMIHYIYWMISIFPGAIAIALHAKKHNESLDYVLSLVLWAAFVQSLFSIAAFLNNDIKLFLIDKLQADDTLVMATYKNEIYYRLFGFSSGLTFDMPAAMSGIACIALYFAINKNILYLLFMPTLVFSALINARTSIVVIGIGIITMFIANKYATGKSVKRVLFIFVAAVLGITIGIMVLRQVSPLTFGWVKSGIGQLLGFVRGDTDSGYFEYLTENGRWQLPSGFSLLLGTGSRIMGGGQLDAYSDVGYINDIWFGGIAYMTVLYLLVVKMVWKLGQEYSRKLDSSFLFYFALVYIISLPILNIKTFIVSIGAFSTLFIIVYTYSVLFKCDETEVLDE